MTPGAVVLLSGGHDSVAALRWASSRYVDVVAIGFSYGQPHVKELNYAQKACLEGDPIEFRRVSMGECLSGGFLGGVEDELGAKGVNPAFVPGRNAVFLAAASSFGATIFDEFDLIIGGTAEDRGGFPDCTVEFFSAMSTAITLGLGRRVSICAPWSNMTKAEIFEQAGPALRLELRSSWSCYRGAATPCGTCTPCVARKKAGSF